MKLIFYPRSPRKGTAVVISDSGAVLERIACWAHTPGGQARVRQQVEASLAHMSRPVELEVIVEEPE